MVCQWCGNRYRNIMRSDAEVQTQGDACAASVFQATEATAQRGGLVQAGEWLVMGHYGSSDYDTCLFRFAKNHPRAEADPVCDNCIGERISAGDLTSIEGHYL